MKFFVFLLLIQCTSLLAFSMNREMNRHQKDIVDRSSALNSMVESINSSNQEVLANGSLPKMRVSDQKRLLSASSGLMESVKEAIVFSESIINASNNPAKCTENISAINQMYNEAQLFLTHFSGLDVEGKDHSEALNELAFGFMNVGFLGAKTKLDVLLVCSLERSK